MANASYVLEHALCSSCVWGENGHYNVMCAHCPYCTYSKGESGWMSRETAEFLKLVKRKESVNED